MQLHKNFAGINIYVDTGLFTTHEYLINRNVAVTQIASRNVGTCLLTAHH